jgi:hypothetical protein
MDDRYWPRFRCASPARQDEQRTAEQGSREEQARKSYNRPHPEG